LTTTAVPREHLKIRRHDSSRIGCADDAIANFPPTFDAGPRRRLRRGPASSFGINSIWVVSAQRGRSLPARLGVLNSSVVGVDHTQRYLQSPKRLINCPLLISVITSLRKRMPQKAARHHRRRAKPQRTEVLLLLLRPYGFCSCWCYKTMEKAHQSPDPRSRRSTEDDDDYSFDDSGDDFDNAAEEIGDWGWCVVCCHSSARCFRSSSVLVFVALTFSARLLTANPCAASGRRRGCSSGTMSWPSCARRRRRPAPRRSRSRNSRQSRCAHCRRARTEASLLPFPLSTSMSDFSSQMRAARVLGSVAVGVVGLYVALGVGVELWPPYGVGIGWAIVGLSALVRCNLLVLVVLLVVLVVLPLLLLLLLMMMLMMLMMLPLLLLLTPSAVSSVVITRAIQAAGGGVHSSGRAGGGRRLRAMIISI